MDIKREELTSIIEEVVRRVKEKIDPSSPSQTGAKAQCPTCLCSSSQPSPSPSSCSSCGECVVKKPDEVREIVTTGAARVSAPAKIPAGDIAKACASLAGYIDHTLLKPDAKEDEIVVLCKEAMKNHFASVCVNPSYVPLCSKLLAGSGVMVCTVVGFPLGAMTTEAKAFETRDAVMKGADEIDMVINIGKLKSGDYKTVIEDIQGVVKAAQKKTVKVIIEAAHLNDYEKVIACVLCKAGGAHFVKTSTGFAPSGATVNDVALMRKVVGEEMGVKAAGGIRDCETALNMVHAGATRIGASASVKIIAGEKKSEKKSSY